MHNNEPICPETGVPVLQCMKHADQYDCDIDHHAEDPPEIDRPEGSTPNMMMDPSAHFISE